MSKPSLKRSNNIVSGWCMRVIQQLARSRFNREHSGTLPKVKQSFLKPKPFKECKIALYAGISENLLVLW
ncbi:MAG: hypothetical protein UV59_C0012G0002 [Candidatus Gottesmanbacteria bacterium GW2011_GWA1_43_11]|uniref:Uncharacterized protein n=1 Tax=Candidatus Gottesmanbacteria bacterium GW2011_GWA1_43_11 TaxID=1618436 RepID=A0A0G1CGG5_9BACT|nr:MAG: hypothetical protein UV59_C0012G0002 [Candidatus Gottesmanbacteria bacterium GW2011_GWA1_43_11]